MARRRGFSQGRAPYPRRAVQWNQGPGSEATSGFTSSQLDILGAGVVAVDEKFTIVRMRGELTMALQTVSAVDEGYHLTYGIGIVSADAFAVGASAVPNPQDDPEWPWMFHGFTAMISPSATLSDIGSAAVVRVPVDVKAMRILNPNETVFMAIDALEVGTAVLNVQFDSRMLIKLF